MSLLRFSKQGLQCAVNLDAALAAASGHERPWDLEDARAAARLCSAFAEHWRGAADKAAVEIPRWCIYIHVAPEPEACRGPASS